METEPSVNYLARTMNHHHRNCHWHSCSIQKTLCQTSARKKNNEQRKRTFWVILGMTKNSPLLKFLPEDPVKMMSCIVASSTPPTSPLLLVLILSRVSLISNLLVSLLLSSATVGDQKLSVALLVLLLLVLLEYSSSSRGPSLKTKNTRRSGQEELLSIRRHGTSSK